ncbi:MAG: GNAT family N-acetyltransferase [Candidatus Parvarchaeota archaeon]|nr:GNAT family N-acetyltransferase [Candidatus Rehaiarchaeum fermentans]
MDFRITKAYRKDKNEILRLIKSEIYPEFKLNKIKELVGNISENFWFVIRNKKGKVKGAICFSEYDTYENSVVYDIEFLAIDKIIRGKGFGRLLLLEGIKRINKKIAREKRNISIIFTQTDGENKNAIGFYSNVLGKLGKIQITEIKDAWLKTESGNRNIVFIFSKIDQKKLRSVLNTITL